MNDELIRKSEVLELLCNTGVSRCPMNCAGEALDSLYYAIDCWQPVNAVELPCKVGDTIFTTNGGRISESRVKRITFFENRYLLTVKDFYLGNDFVIDEWEIDPNKADGQYTFFTREEAEKALEDLKNENK